MASSFTEVSVVTVSTAKGSLMSQQRQGVPYIPLHDRPLPPRNPNMPPSPRYAPNSDDEAERDAEQQAEGSRSASRKRQRSEEEQARSVRPSRAPEIVSSVLAPSIFGVAPRVEFTATVGKWLMDVCRGQEHVEIEIKLGHLMRSGQPMAAASWTEGIVPPDFMGGHSFVSNMAPVQHAAYNKLLNDYVVESQRTPHRIQYTHTYHTDSTYDLPRLGKTRVTTDREGRFVEAVHKRRLGDLNVRSPQQLFDWRISVSTETPAGLTEVPPGRPSMKRYKDRMSYKHQLCQVDLTKVTVMDGSQAVSFEIEVEVLDVQTLLAEGAKEAEGQPSMFDDALQSILDSVRMLAKNAVPPR